MFRPNLTGEIQSLTGRDVHGRETWSDPRPCPFAIVNLDVSNQKTTVRADSSASRGAAEERVVNRGNILVQKSVAVAIGDRFSFEDISYEISSVHRRRSVSGILDHIECGLALLP